MCEVSLANVTTPLTLDAAPLGTPLVLMGTHPDSTVARRLASLGLRRGARVSLTQKLTTGGRIVSVGGGRVAIDARVLRGLAAEVAP